MHSYVFIYELYEHCTKFIFICIQKLSDILLDYYEFVGAIKQL